MDAELNTDGIILERESYVFNQTSETMQDDFGGALDLSDDALMGVYTDIMSLSETNLWELSGAVYDSSNLLATEGYLLDNLALLVGIIRLPASSTRGVVWFLGDDGTIIPQGGVVQSILGDFFQVEQETQITSTSCLETKVYINEVVQGEDYTIGAGQIGSVQSYRRTATPNQTAEEILQYFVGELSQDGELDVEYFEQDEGGEPYLLIKKVTTNQTMSITGSTYFSFRDVIAPAVVSAQQTGAIQAKANTVTRYLPELGTQRVISVTNPFDFEVGRELETDNELRTRVITAYQRVSGGSPNALINGISAVDGVLSVKMFENITADTSPMPKQLPPKSFQLVVYGGNPQLIGEAIWENKPAGIEPYATGDDEEVIITDFNGQQHLVRFVRPSVKYIWVHIDYNLYSEERFPASGESIMREECAIYGQSLDIGDDVIPDRFYTPIYRNVSGVNDVEVYIATRDSLDPPPAFPADYTQVTIDVSDEEITNFSFANVSVERFSGNLPDRGLPTPP